jgi:hypothetical protein
MFHGSKLIGIAWRSKFLHFYFVCKFVEISQNMTKKNEYLHICVLEKMDKVVVTTPLLQR